MVIMTSGIARGRVRTTTTESHNMAAITETRLNFSVARHHRKRTHSGVDEIFQTNLKEKSREQELARTEVARKIAKDKERRRKWY